MGRLAWSQARFRPARTLALIAGVLVAAIAFTVLTAASRTAQLRTTGTVSAHFVPAYDILIRPRGARTAVENRTGTVQPDFLSGIYGGITMAQYHQIQHVPGVQVAAPMVMVGYAELQAAIFEPVPAAALAGSGRQLYRISTTWVSGNGASRVAQPPSYLYVTPLRLTGGYNGIPPTDGTEYSLASLDMENFKNGMDKMKELNAKVRDAVRANADKAFDELAAEEAKRQR